LSSYLTFERIGTDNINMYTTAVFRRKALWSQSYYGHINNYLCVFLYRFCS